MKVRQLYNKTKQKIVVERLHVASTFKDRFLGLMPFSCLESDEGMLIERCSSIHTFFMSFTIDCYFMNMEQRVVSISKYVGPYWFSMGRIGSSSVLEVASMCGKNIDIDVDDILEIKEKE